MKIYVAIATTGRPALVSQVVNHLSLQSRQPDGIVVIAAGPEDVNGLVTNGEPVDIEFAPKGSCSQRNHGLRKLQPLADLIAFFDDDFILTADYLANAERYFLSTPDAVGLTGRVFADGVRTGGIAFEDAAAMVQVDAENKVGRAGVLPRNTLYGCNMVFRASALSDLYFDERLPLYGWLEDIDFTSRLGLRGPMAQVNACSGIHMGTQSGRSPGKRLGYSQVANPIYILRKGNISWDFMLRSLAQNLVANLVGSIGRDPKVDRRGRLWGNALAILDLLRGKLDTRRILEF